MEKESIAYFYLQKNTVAKNNVWSKIQLNEFCVERRDRLVIKAIGIPEYYMESCTTQLKQLWRAKTLHKRKESINEKIDEKNERRNTKTVGKTETTVRNAGNRKKIPWEREKLICVCVEEFQKSGAEYFFYGEEMALFMEQRMPEIPLFFMEEMLLQYGIRENLILVGNPNVLFESVFQNFMQRVNFLRIICDTSEEYEEAAEWLYENYGIIVRFGIKRNAAEGESRQQDNRYQEGIKGLGNVRSELMETLVIDIEPCGKNGRPQIDILGLPKGTIYMDMCSEGEKARWIMKKRKDIHYLSPESLLNKWCHLDTTAQNGYNTRVKLEVL